MFADAKTATPKRYLPRRCNGWGIKLSRCNAIGRWKNGRCNECQQLYDYDRNRTEKRQNYKSAEYRKFSLSGKWCANCGSMRDLTRDHIIPLAAGGTNEESNLQVLCRSCNSSKQDKIVETGGKTLWQ